MAQTSVSLLRGADTIGGSCVKITHGDESIMLDYGLPLMASGGGPLDAEFTKKPSVENGILLDVMNPENGKAPLAFIISHAHPDHYGLIDYLPSTMPVYISDSAHSLMQIGNTFYNSEMQVSRLPHCQIYRAGRKFQIGPFTIIAYLMDHSAFGACSIHVQVAGKSIFYTGDFRGHGRKSNTIEYITNRVKQPDVLLMEGTTLDDGHPNTFDTEFAVERAFISAMQKDSSPMFVAGSGSNIDRIVSLYNASKRAGRLLVLDLYQVYMLEALQQYSPALPPHKGDHIRVFFPKNQIESVKKNYGEKDFFRFKERHINIEKLDFDNEQYVFRVSNYVMKRFITAFIERQQKVRLIYSMWQGYMQMQPSFNDLATLANSEWQYIHTSGHAYLSDLKKFSVALDAKNIIPIHTVKAGLFKEHFDNVTELNNGDTFVVK